MEKEINIIAPDGYEIDRDNSTLDCNRFKPVELNVVHPPFPKEGLDCKINNRWAFTVYGIETQGDGNDGHTASGHKSSIFLAGCNGNWFDENGNVVRGNFYFKPFKIL